MRAERKPRTVVACENNQRVTIESRCFKRIENSTRAVVELFDDITVDPGGAVTYKLGRSRQRNVRHRMREVKQERLGSILVDEVDRFLCISLRQRSMIRRPL